MPFSNSIAQEIAGLDQRDPYRILLENMRLEALGRNNSKAFGVIEAELAQRGVNVTQTQFQQTLLKKSRGGQVFIGSTDHGPHRSYFLIETPDDAEVAREFYRRRIHDQQVNLNLLEDLMRQAFPNHQINN